MHRVTELIEAIIPFLKALHIAALFIWCGGLFSLPLMLSHHDPRDSQADFARLRLATHQTYIFLVTPSAVVAVAAGTWLQLLSEVFMPWMYAKLLFVALLVATHAWLGHIITLQGEVRAQHHIPPAYLTIGAAAVPTLIILVLVLGKPSLSGVSFPDWLTHPRGNQLPFEVPSR
jgi:uncharacterized membrane protein